jgi:hypothetical protein
MEAVLAYFRRSEEAGWYSNGGPCVLELGRRLEPAGAVDLDGGVHDQRVGAGLERGAQADVDGGDATAGGRAADEVEAELVAGGGELVDIGGLGAGVVDDDGLDRRRGSPPGDEPAGIGSTWARMARYAGTTATTWRTDDCTSRYSACVGGA